MKETSSSRLDYPGFCQYIRDNIMDYIDDETVREKITQICIMPVIKNNETVLDALQIYEPDMVACPVIYLDDYYSDYSMGTPICEIMRSVARFYLRSREQDCLLSFGDMASFDRVRDRIIMRLVSYTKNSNILELCPYRLFVDMAVTYRILAAKNEGGISTVLVTDKMLQHWHVSETLLYELALVNTRRLFPPKIKSLSGLILEKSGTILDKDLVWENGKSCYDKSLYVATNDCGINGATVICYPDILADFARKTGSDFYILPSSIHEVILLSADRDVSPQTLVSMLTDANQSIVAKDEILSDSIYYYCADQEKIEKYSGQIERNLLK